MDTRVELTDKERSFMVRIMKRKNLSLSFSILSILVAAFFLVYHGLIMHDLNAIRFVVVILLLLSGRSHLKLYKCAVIFSKVKFNTSSNEEKVGTG